MERLVIAVYKPLAGKQNDLEKLTKAHWSRLNELGLVSRRKPIIGRAADGSIVEVFGWKSKEAMNEAHGLPEVLAIWEEYARVSTYIPVADLKEVHQLFAEFTPLDPQ